MRGRPKGRGANRARATLMMGLLVAAGCHAKRPGVDNDFSEAGSFPRTQSLVDKLDTARTAIISACRKESFVNASRGLIVSETGLHEDVFELRDRVSYRAAPFGLGEAKRLENLLQQELANGSTRSMNSMEQTACIRQFAEHLQTLTEPLVLEDEAQKRLDLSAFNTSSKEAQDELEQEDKAMRQPVEEHP